MANEPNRDDYQTVIPYLTVPGVSALIDFLIAGLGAWLPKEYAPVLLHGCLI